MMTEQRYLTLMSFKLNQYCKKQKKFIRQYIKEKRCKCVGDVLPNDILNCEHLRKAMRKEFRKEELQLWDYTINAVADDLHNMGFNPDKFRVKK